jgi:RNA recognition motif-containing protein
MSRVVYARGFPSTFTTEDLLQVFKPFGKLKKHRIINEEGKLFALLTFFNADKAKNSINELNNKSLNGINWIVAKCEKLEERNSLQIKEAKKEENRKKTLYLRDFPESFNEEQAAMIFSRYGNISKIFFNEKVCFVTFENEEFAKNALENEKFLKVEGKRVFVSLLLSKRKISGMIMNKKIFKRRRNHKNDRICMKPQNVEPRLEDEMLTLSLDP